MAKRADKKPMSAKNVNSIRRNGKAYKKNSGDARMPETVMHGVREAKRASIRQGMPEQKRNELGHVIKRIDGHDVIVCDHPRGYIHVDLSKV